MMTIKSQLQEKNTKIDKIRGTLKKNKVQVVPHEGPAVDIESSDDHAIDQAVRQFQEGQDEDDNDLYMSDGSSDERLSESDGDDYGPEFEGQD